MIKNSKNSRQALFLGTVLAAFGLLAVTVPAQAATEGNINNAGQGQGQGMRPAANQRPGAPLRDGTGSQLQDRNQVRVENEDQIGNRIENRVENQNQTGERPMNQQGRRPANSGVMGALMSGSWDDFQLRMKGSRLLEIVNNEEKFKKLAEAAELMRNGDREAALEIHQELELDKFREERQERLEARKTTRESMRTILENDDYEAFAEAVAGKPIAEVVDTQAKFEKLVEAYNLIESGDRDAADEILMELGLKK